MSQQPGDSEQLHSRARRSLSAGAEQAGATSVTAHLHAHVGSGNCPLQYDRQSFDDIKAGATPYIFGGDQKPACKNCRAEHNNVARFCRFQLSGHQYKHHICPAAKQRSIVQWFVGRGWRSLLELTPCDLWPHLRARTTWIVGDSQGLDFHIALECFLREFWDLEERPAFADKAVMDQFIAIASIAAHDVPHCEHMPDNTRVCFIRVNNGNDTVNVALPLLYGGLAKPEDVVVVNFGLHHREEEAYLALMQRFAEQYQQHKSSVAAVLWKDTPPQHFRTQTGMHQKGLGQPPFECAPIANVSIQADHTLVASHPSQEVVLQGTWRNEIANRVVKSVGMPVVEAWNETVPLWEYHRDNVLRGYECGHFCHPSASEVWVYQLYESLKAYVPPLRH